MSPKPASIEVSCSFDNVAEACFDRIFLFSPTSIAANSVCQSPPGIHMQACCLMHHTFSRRGQAFLVTQTPHRRTSTSWRGIGHSLGGQLQCGLSSLHSLLKCCLTRQMGFHFQDPHQTLQVKRIIDGFVDDVTFCKNMLQGLDPLSQGTIQETTTRL
jgi:hypothetical protein